MKEPYLLTFRLPPEQRYDFTHRGAPETPPTPWRLAVAISVTPLPCSGQPVSPRQDLVYTSGALTVWLLPGTPLDHMSQVAMGAPVHGSHGMVTNGERVPQDMVQREQTEMHPQFSVKEALLLI